MPPSCLPLPMPSPFLPSASQDDVRRRDPPFGSWAPTRCALTRAGAGRVGLNNDDAGAFVLPQLEVQKICTCVVIFRLVLPFLALSFVPSMHTLSAVCARVAHLPLTSHALLRGRVLSPAPRTPPPWVPRRSLASLHGAPSPRAPHATTATHSSSPLSLLRYGLDAHYAIACKERMTVWQITSVYYIYSTTA